MSRATLLENRIRAILERDFTNPHYYINSSSDDLRNYTESIGNGLFVLKFRKDLLSQYKSNLDKYIWRYEWDYIYQLVGQYRIFNLDSNPARTDKEKIIQRDRFSDKIDGQKLLDMGYDGYLDGDTLSIILTLAERDNTEKYIKLVDGNAVRNNTGSDTGIILPDFVLEEVKGYTTQRNDTFSPKVTDWLKNNFRKPYQSLTVYRGMGISFDYIDDFIGTITKNLTISDVEYFLEDWLGISSITDLKIGEPVSIKRQKESSWTMKPTIAKSFSDSQSEWQKRDFMFLIKATVPADDILVDLNLLNKEYLKKHFIYWTQNEVILASQPISGKISNIWLSKAGHKFLAENGLKLKSGTGIVPA